jgi:hypothetical protein
VAFGVMQRHNKDISAQTYGQNKRCNGRWSTGQLCACLAPRQSVENDNNQECSKQQEE